MGTGDEGWIVLAVTLPKVYRRRGSKSAALSVEDCCSSARAEITLIEGRSVHRFCWKRDHDLNQHSVKQLYVFITACVKCGIYVLSFIELFPKV